MSSPTPEHHDADTRAWSAGQAGEGDPPLLVGVCGITGTPVDGSIELGYGVVPSMQRRGGLEPSLGVMRKLGLTYAGEPEPGVVEYELALA